MIYSDKFNEIFKYTMILHTPYGSPIGSLNKKINELKYSGTFLGTDEISFTVPYYLTNKKTGKREKNPIYDEIKGDYLVLVTNPFFTDEQGKMFVVKDCTEETTDKGYIFKSCLLYTLENKLNDKTITDFEGDSRLIYDPENKRDDSGIEIGFLNHIFNKTSWTLGTISPEYQEKHRALRINNSTMLKALNDVAKTFDCVFVFDTINKTISVKNLSEIGWNKDGYISDRNFIKNLKKTINSSEVKTRLYLYGKDNISIQKINPLGQPYIDNLSFFMTEDYMPKDLIQALNNYRQFVESKKPLFEESIAEYNKINTEIDKIEEELLKAEIELKKRKHEQDLSMIAPDRYPDAKQKAEEQEEIVKGIEDRIDAEFKKIEAETTKIDEIREEMKIDKHFTSEQLSIIDDFIKEDTYTNSDYAEENLQELYDFGIKTLERVSTPAIDFDIDIVDFFSLLEYQTEWHKFRLGDIVRVKNDELDFNYLVRLVGIEHEPDNNNLVLRFTNKDNLNDKSLYLEDVLNNMNTSIASVDWNKFDWDKGKDADENLRKYLDSALDLAKQQIVNGRNQKPLLDERGFWLYKESDAGDISPEQIRMVNNVIALTKDNWETVDIAISPTQGINANLIRGDIIEGVTIKAGTLTGLMSDTVKIDGSLITSGTIEGVTVKADTLSGRMSDKVTIDGSLISTGTIEGVKLKGNEIEGSTITGGTIKGADIIGSNISAGQITVSDDFADTDLGKNIHNEFGQISDKIEGAIDNVKESIGIPMGENKNMYELLTQQGDELKEMMNNNVVVHTGVDVPTTSNKPAVNWDTTELKNKHKNDIYIDASTGTNYKWTGTSWIKIDNKDIKDALDNIDLSGVSQVFLQKSEPSSSDKPNKGDLWILPSGATFTYDDSIDDPYRWQLTSPNLEELAISVFPEIRDKAKELGIGSYIVVSPSSNAIKIDWINMTATMKTFDMPELWVVLYKGYRNFTKNDTVRFYHDMTSSVTADSQYIGYYNKTIGELGVLTKDASGSYVWRKVNDKVETGKSYNNVIITPEKGVVVQDEYGNDKLVMGGWKDLKWGDSMDYGFRYNYTDDHNDKVLYLGRNGLTMYYPDSKMEASMTPLLSPSIHSYEYTSGSYLPPYLNFSLPGELAYRYVSVVVSIVGIVFGGNSGIFDNRVEWYTNGRHENERPDYWSAEPMKRLVLPPGPLIWVRPAMSFNSIDFVKIDVRVDYFIEG